MKILDIPNEIRRAAEMGAAIGISISGGKDSQALLEAVVGVYKSEGWTGPIFAIYADLGRATWKGTKEFVQAMAARAGVPLRIVRRKDGRDLIDHMKARLHTIQASGESKPFWPSSEARYCTSDTKRDPINSELIQFDLIISVEGVRAQESAKRARKPVLEIRKKITAARINKLTPADALDAWELGVYTKKGKRRPERLAFDWRAIHAWNRREVWEGCGTSSFDVGRRRVLYAQGDEEKALDGATVHPAYVYGNERFSCALCVLAKEADIRNGARHNPEVFQELLAMQRESGYTFTTFIDLETLA